MAKTVDQVVVIDVESTCWRGAPPEGHQSDIIEVGVVLLDVATLKRHGKRSIMVRPTRSEVSDFCTELTSIRPEDVATAGGLDEACRTLRREYDSRRRVWASYGDYDRRQFRRNCSDLGVGFPFGPTHLNVKNLAAVLTMREHEPSLPEALEQVGIEFEGTHHRGHDDAWNIAALLAHLIRTFRAGADG